MLHFTYVQATGELYSPQGTLLGVGYAGRDKGLNNPGFEMEKGIGPIPTGFWEMGTPKDHPESVGAYAIELKRAAIPYGRSSFYIHGDNRLGNKSASHGCIVISRIIRQAIAANACKTLLVIAWPLKGEG